ncbi:Protein of unknown function [Bradyrhizobium sp. NFR13]|uniref:DUF3072 domain-containing protein n=1 Tax=Nitrobacteraceae TaxID=41294 RepID=UPI0008E169A0|nr:DUF3072 domain-containing protein [Bradyrhizobium sp. NFR13]SFL51634.1 Protein of unknown function [Bradyrhizobium sp. NFR13]
MTLASKALALNARSEIVVPAIAASVSSYESLPDRLSGPMTRGQALTLKSLAIEAYQPKQFEKDLTRAEAARRIEALKQEIALADSF